MTKRPFGTPNVRLMGDFKAIALDYAFWSSNGTEGALYCLNDRDVYVLLALCEYAGWWTRWYNTDDISRAEIAALAAELENKLMSCVDITVLVEQAKLNQAQSSQAQVVAAAAARQVLEDRYDGTPTSINPSAPDTFWGLAPSRYDALCAGLTAFVYQFARSQADLLRVGQVGGLAAAALVAALLIPGLNFFFVVGASIAVLLGLGTIGVTTEVAIAALTDKSALGDVICFMRDTLKAQSVTEANWNACLNSYPFPVGSNAAIVADFVKSTLTDNYLTILNILGQAYEGTLNGDALPDCPCPPPPERTPVIASDWDPAHTAGTIVGPDIDGFWTATSGTRAYDEAITIMDADGLPFIFTDVTYSEPLQCQVWFLDNVNLHFACGIGNQYTGQTIDQYVVTWYPGAHKTMRFKMVAP